METLRKIATPESHTQQLHVRPRDIVGSAAFNLEYETSVLDAELRDDIVSYLGEYRLQVQKFDYELDYFADNPFAREEIRDCNKGESMQQKARRAIEDRALRGEPTHREVAEYQAFSFLNEQLASAKDGDMLFWASPPGPREEGYGTYGFLFQGKVKDSYTNKRKRLAMTAIRVEDPSVAQYNRAMSELTGAQWDINNVDDFLASPVVVSSISDYTVDHILQKNFSFQLDESDRAMTDWILRKLDPAIKEFIVMVKTGTKEEKLHAFHSLENYALELKAAYREQKNIPYEDKNAMQLSDIMGSYNYEPPKVGGSCGSSDNKSSIFGISYESLASKLGISLLLEDKYGSREFDCPDCGETNTRPKDKLLKNCQHCGSKAVGC